MGKHRKDYAEFCIGGCGRRSVSTSDYCGKGDLRHTCKRMETTGSQKSPVAWPSPGNRATNASQTANR